MYTDIYKAREPCIVRQERESEGRGDNYEGITLTLVLLLLPLLSSYVDLSEGRKDCSHSAEPMTAPVIAEYFLFKSRSRQRALNNSALSTAYEEQWRRICIVYRCFALSTDRGLRLLNFKNILKASMACDDLCHSICEAIMVASPHILILY